MPIPSNLMPIIQRTEEAALNRQLAIVEARERETGKVAHLLCWAKYNGGALDLQVLAQAHADVKNRFVNPTEGPEADQQEFDIAVLGEPKRLTNINAAPIDFKMLRGQKDRLVAMTSAFRLSGAVEEEDLAALAGIIHLLDYIQDQVADQIGDAEVFGEG